MRGIWSDKAGKEFRKYNRYRTHTIKNKNKINQNISNKLDSDLEPSFSTYSQLFGNTCLYIKYLYYFF